MGWWSGGFSFNTRGVQFYVPDVLHGFLELLENLFAGSDDFVMVAFQCVFPERTSLSKKFNYGMIIFEMTIVLNGLTTDVTLCFVPVNLRPRCINVDHILE